MTARELYQQALQYFKHDQLPHAQAALEKAILLDPHLLDAYEALALIYEKQDRLDDAVSTTQELITLAPETLMAHVNLSRFYMLKGMLQEAEHEQAEARRLSWKQELTAKKQRGEPVPAEAEVQVQAEADLADRIDRYRQVIALDPRDVLGYFSLGSAYNEAMRFSEAAQVFRQGLDVDPEHSSSYVGLGQALEALGQKAEAQHVYEQGIAVADRHGDMIPQKKMQSRLRVLKTQQE